MATPSSKTAIANLGLRALQTSPVVSIDPPDEDSKPASVMAAWYDQSRREVLEDHPWEFARKRLVIPAESTAPAFEYLYQYELPADYVRLVRIGENYDGPELDYEIEGRYLLCNETSPINLVYISNESNVTRFSAKFIACLYTKLAASGCMEVTGNAALKDRLDKEYIGLLTTAASVSGQNRPPRRIQRSKFRDARRGFGRNDRTVY